MRHRISTEPISLTDGSLLSRLEKAQDLQAHGKWYLAGEEYSTLARTLKTQQPLLREAARTFARAATCFELSGQNRDAARAYFEAASLLHNNKIGHQDAGELFNRAAFNFKTVSEFFNAGDSYRRAALAFADVSADTIQTNDNIPPVPAGAGKFTIAGRCFTAGAEAFLHSDPAWARATYWEAGKMHLRQGHGYHAYVAFRRALTVCIQFDQTHEGDQLRKALPMSDEERKQKVDPVKVLEQAAFQGHQHHYGMNPESLKADWARSMTDKDMISSFHEFCLEFTKIGNQREANKYYVMEKKRQQKMLRQDKKCVASFGYWIWGVTCGYGESLWRWTATCLVILIIFALGYAGFDLLDPATRWTDYLSFSFSTFTNIGQSDTRANGLIGKTFVTLQILSGWLMLGMLLTFVIRRTFR